MQNTDLADGLQNRRAERNLSWRLSVAETETDGSL